MCLTVIGILPVACRNQFILYILNVILERMYTFDVKHFSIIEYLDTMTRVT